jgi:CHAT domain-containing protein
MPLQSRRRKARDACFASRLAPASCRRGAAVSGRISGFKTMQILLRQGLQLARSILGDHGFPLTLLSLLTRLWFGNRLRLVHAWMKLYPDTSTPGRLEVFPCGAPPGWFHVFSRWLRAAPKVGLVWLVWWGLNTAGWSGPPWAPWLVSAGFVLDQLPFGRHVHWPVLFLCLGVAGSCGWSWLVWIVGPVICWWLVRRSVDLLVLDAPLLGVRVALEFEANRDFSEAQVRLAKIGEAYGRVGLHLPQSLCLMQAAFQALWAKKLQVAKELADRACSIPSADNASAHPLFLRVLMQREMLRLIVGAKAQASSEGSGESQPQDLTLCLADWPPLLEVVLRGKVTEQGQVKRVRGRGRGIFASIDAYLQLWDRIADYCGHLSFENGQPNREGPPQLLALRAALVKETEAAALAHLLTKVRKSRGEDNSDEENSIDLLVPASAIYQRILTCPAVPASLPRNELSGALTGYGIGFAVARLILPALMVGVSWVTVLVLHQAGLFWAEWIGWVVTVWFGVRVGWALLGLAQRNAPKRAIWAAMELARLGAFVEAGRALERAAEWYDRQGLLLARSLCLSQAAQFAYFAGQYEKVQDLLSHACRLPPEDNASAHPRFHGLLWACECMLDQIYRELGAERDLRTTLLRIYQRSEFVRNVLASARIYSAQEWFEKHEEVCQTTRPSFALFKIWSKYEKLAAKYVDCMWPLQSASQSSSCLPSMPAALVKETEADSLAADMIFPDNAPKSYEAVLRDAEVFSKFFPPDGRPPKNALIPQALEHLLKWTAVQNNNPYFRHQRELLTAVLNYERGRVFWMQGKLSQAYYRIVLSMAWSRRWFCARPEVSPAVLFYVYAAAGEFLASGGDPEAAGKAWTRALTELLKLIAQNRWPAAMARIMKRFDDLLPSALKQSIEAFEKTKDDRWLWNYLQLVDGSRCASVRDGLRRHLRRPVRRLPQDPWPGDPAVSLSEGPSQGPLPQGSPRGIDGFPSQENHSSQEIDPVTGLPFLEFPPELREDQITITTPPGAEDLKRILQENDTVILYLLFEGDDFVALPVRRVEDTPKILKTKNGLFRVPGVRKWLITPAVNASGPDGEAVEPNSCPDEDSGANERDSFVARHEACWKDCVGWDPPIDDEPGAGLDSLYEELWNHLSLGLLMDHIEPDPQKRQELHLILIPATEFLSLPLHAARDRRSNCYLLDQFASLRYSLSLGASLLQTEDSSGFSDNHLRGVVFANSYEGRKGEYTVLEGARKEVAILLKEGPQNWWVHADWCSSTDRTKDNPATLELFRRRHASGNVLWCIGHGQENATDTIPAPSGEEVAIQRPSLILEDGVVSSDRLVAEGYDFGPVQLLYNSCCLLGKLKGLERSQEIVGFTAALTMLRCRRVVGALWEIHDESSVEFARYWARALLTHAFSNGTPRSSHAFAIAIKEAVNGLRTAENAKFAHPYFWAAYTLMGLG